jgi:hypothetical protein
MLIPGDAAKVFPRPSEAMITAGPSRQIGANPETRRNAG